MLEDQREWMREEKEQKQEVGGQHTARAHYQHQGLNESIACPRSVPPPLVHPNLAVAQLGLTPEEATKVHKECLHTQEEIQWEIGAEDRAVYE